MEKDITILIANGLFPFEDSPWWACLKLERFSTQSLRFAKPEQPSATLWTAQLDKAIHDAPSDVIIVAHDLACHVVARWAADLGQDGRNVVRGVILVAPSEFDPISVPEAYASFVPLAVSPMPCPSLVLAADDDPSPWLARLTRNWGAVLIARPEATEEDLGAQLISHLLSKDTADYVFPRWLVGIGRR